MSRLVAGSNITDLLAVAPKVKLDGGTPSVWHFPEASGYTSKVGTCVCLSGSASTAKVLADIGTDASGYGVLGFLAEDAGNVLSNKTAVYIATPDTVFVGNVNEVTTSANAQTAATDVGQCYGIANLSGKAYIDKTKTAMSSVLCRIIGLHEQDNHPCFYGRAYFVVPTNKCQLYTTDWVHASGYTAYGLQI